MTVRSGIGFDVHPLVQGRALVLGGIAIPYEQGLAGHSDGDGLIHAVIDAMLGAAALGDIGTHFPPGDDRYKGIASGKLLRATLELLRSNRWRVTFVDATILAERPILKPHMHSIRESLAATLQLTEDCVSVKATTTDGLGFIGRGEGIGTLAIATIERIT
jgi:2-C-methyl-D-erythritol 2,4-cyclodiphosphate synthase